MNYQLITYLKGYVSRPTFVVNHHGTPLLFSSYEDCTKEAARIKAGLTENDNTRFAVLQYWFENDILNGGITHICESELTTAKKDYQMPELKNISDLFQWFSECLKPENQK
jgi:hypothetical protein